MFRRITFSVLLLALLMTQGAAAVCQLKCAEQGLSGLSDSEQVRAGMQHCQHMDMTQQEAPPAALHLLSDCSNHVCAVDLSALSQEKVFITAPPVTVEAIALPRGDASILPSALRAMLRLRTERPILPSALADPLTTSLRV